MNPFLRKNVISHLDDRTYYGNKAHLAYQDENGYFISDWVASGNYAEDLNCPVIYRINKDGFRSDHFKIIDEKNISILFGGCSWTFGEGLPEEYTWTKMLCNKISNKLNKKVDYFNTGYMGSSIDLIIKNTMAFIREYGKPNYIFLLLPDMARKTRFNKLTNDYYKAFPHPDWIAKEKSHAQKKYTLEYEFENNVYDSLNLLHLFEDYCSESNIKLLWGTWFSPEKYYYINSRFKYFIDQDDIVKNFKESLSIDSKDEYYPNLKNLPYWRVAKDNCHPGTAWTHFIVEVFFQKGVEREYY